MDRTDEVLHDRPFVEGLPESVRELLRSQSGLDELTRKYLDVSGRADSFCQNGARLLRYWRHCHLHLVETGQARDEKDEFSVQKNEVEEYLKQQVS